MGALRRLGGLVLGVADYLSGRFRPLHPFTLCPFPEHDLYCTCRPEEPTP